MHSAPAWLRLLPTHLPPAHPALPWTAGNRVRPADASVRRSVPAAPASVRAVHEACARGEFPLSFWQPSLLTLPEMQSARALMLWSRPASPQRRLVVVSSWFLASGVWHKE